MTKEAEDNLRQKGRAAYERKQKEKTETEETKRDRERHVTLVKSLSLSASHCLVWFGLQNFSQ